MKEPENTWAKRALAGGVSKVLRYVGLVSLLVQAVAHQTKPLTFWDVMGFVAAGIMIFLSGMIDRALDDC